MNALSNHEYNDELHEYRIYGQVVPSVTQILTAARLYNDSYFTEESRIRGKYIHKACLYELHSDLNYDSVPIEYMGYIEAFKLFLGTTNCTPYLAECEIPLFSETLRYGGTPDLPCMLNNVDTVIDIKSGNETITTGVQLAGYEQLMNRHVKRYGLYLKADGKYRLIPYADRNDIKIFNAALTLYNYRVEKGLL